MEVADQWRRQWAEYGKVTEGGVTRRTARAMEVLHASAPGAKVRVMRAAYHSSAGPGAPSSSYLMHSSRRVISSGYLPEPTLALPSKPLEVSSMPLELSPDVDNEKLNYKVTEPDDIEISEPSKWRNATGKRSVRMPSEESSSTDNASIIDLDSRNSSRNTFTRNFHNSESNEDSIKNIHTRNNRVSPLLDAPVSLSTLKYTSLLNGSEEWSNRRKSYSFEDTTSLNSNSSFNKPDTINIMDSSTDSGICKSTEIVTDHNFHNFENPSRRISKEKLSDLPEESFHDWLHKGRPKAIFKPTSISPLKEYRERYLTDENNMISLQSRGKVTITLPVTIERDDKDSSSSQDENDRKTKRVGFSKTELHFAAESGTVNIIATDEKPPPSNDFRRKKSVFAPFTQKVDKSITLFGEKSIFTEVPNGIDLEKQEYTDLDENTAATRGILKNRIPKPKPYLLGENMALGESVEEKFRENKSFPTALTALINKQLENDKKQNGFFSVKTTDDVTYDTDKSYLRTLSAGPPKHTKSLNNKSHSETGKSTNSSIYQVDEYKPLFLTSTNEKFKTRQLRDSDLTYFGIKNKKQNEELQTLDNLQEEILHSVKLVQKISNSVCNSEAESDDTPEYQNISNVKYRPVPTPKPRTKYIEVASERNQGKSLKSISETENDVQKCNRSPRLQNTHESVSPTTQSYSGREKDSQIIRNKVHDSSAKRSTSFNRKHNKALERNKGDDDTKHYASSKRPIETVYVNISPKKMASAIFSEGRNSPTKTRLNNNYDVTTTRGNYEITKDKPKNDDRKPKRTEKLSTPDRSITRKDNRTVASKAIAPQASMKIHDLSIENKQKAKKYTGDKVEIHQNESTKEGRVHVNKETKSKRSSNNRTNVVTKSNNLTPDGFPLKSKDTGNTERSSSKTRKSKYVINYDDKNGTVSSIRKINQDILRKEPLQKVPTTDSKMKVKTSKTGFRK